VSTDLQTFSFTPDLAIRAVVKEGQPWFIAKEVCDALGHTNPSKAVSDHVDPEDKDSVSLGLPGSAPLMVNESGMYSLIMRSKKPEAKVFQKWVTGTVLPSLRRDGLYIAGQEKPITDDLTLTELLAKLADIQAKVDTIKEAQLRSWSRHQEEKEARSMAFKFLKGGSHRKRKTPIKPQ